MGLLGDFLEVVFSPGDRFRTLRATIRCWEDLGRAQAATGSDPSPIGRRKLASSDQPRIREAEKFVWLAPPGRARVETRRTADGKPESSLRIVNGQKSWERDTQGHVFVNDNEKTPALTDVERHFDPRLIYKFCENLAFEAQGRVKTAGRDCVRLRAILRDGEGLWPHWLPKEANEYEFHGDLERGVFLAIFARHGGVVFESMVVTEVAFDEPLDDALFSYVPRLGEQLAPAPPIIETLSLQAAITRVPFTILLPACIPDHEHTQPQFHYHPPRGPGGSGWRSFTIHYFNFHSRKSLWITESDTPDPDDALYEWKDMAADDQRLRVSDPGAGGLRLVALERQGTHIRICTNIEEKQLLDLVRSLTDARKMTTAKGREEFG